MKSVEEDAMEVKDIATGYGSLTEKAEKTAEALKDPGAPVSYTHLTLPTNREV